MKDRGELLGTIQQLRAEIERLRAQCGDHEAWEAHLKSEIWRLRSERDELRLIRAKGR